MRVQNSIQSGRERRSFSLRRWTTGCCVAIQLRTFLGALLLFGFVGASAQGASLSAAWTAVGPVQIASQRYGTVSGRVTAVAIDPADSTGNTVYVGTTGGGVWKSTNAAGPAASVIFTPLTDTLSVFSANAGTAVMP